MPGSLTIALVDALPYAILLVDRNEKVVWANPVAAHLFGPELAGRPFVTVLRHPAIGEALEAALRDGVAGRVRVTIAARAKEIIALATVAPLPHVGMVLGEVRQVCGWQDFDIIEILS